MERREISNKTAASLFNVVPCTVNKLKRESIDLTRFGLDQLIRFGIALGFDVTIEVSHPQDIYPCVRFSNAIIDSANNE